MLTDALRWRAEGPPSRSCAGDELAGELGIAVGAARRASCSEELAEAQYAGEIATREQALAYVRGTPGDQRRHPARLPSG